VSANLTPGDHLEQNILNIHKAMVMKTSPENDGAGLQFLSPEATAVYREFEAELNSGLRILPDKPEETIPTTLAALWHAAAGQALSAQKAIQAPLPVLDRCGIARLREMLQQRLAGIPLAHLTGRQWFMELDLLAEPGALIPREETELLGWAALERLHAIIAKQEHAKVIDICTGSGNLALALAWNEGRANVWGADLSEEAVALARRNASHLGLADRVEFRTGDLLAPFDTPEFIGQVDLLVCNPPYISSSKVDGMPGEIIGHEPRLAFDGGPLGIRIVTRLINEAPRFLRPKGSIAFEVGLGQGRGVRGRLEKHGAYIDIREISDRNGEVRALIANVTRCAT
jgi:release factor glutamine methyltransferase